MPQLQVVDTRMQEELMNNTPDERLRTVAQILISEIGADGPMDAEDAAANAVQLIKNLTADRDEWQQQHENALACWRTDNATLLAEIAAWKDASQLELAGDPDGVLPRHLAEYIAEQDALCTRLANARHEAARLGYCAGHSDTVEGTYADPAEVAADICQEMDDDERMVKNA